MFYAIVKVENNRVAKYLDFEKKGDADAHVKEYGGFVHESNEPISHLHIDGRKVSTSIPTKPTPEPSSFEILKEAVGQEAYDLAKSRLMSKR